MRIALTLLSGVSYGGLTYVRNIVPALARTDRRNEYHIFLSKGHPLFKSISQDNFILHECGRNTASAPVRFLWEQVRLPAKLRRHKIDLLFTAKNAGILLASCKTVVCLRNMEPLCWSGYKNHWKLNVFSWMRQMMTRMSLRRADGVVAVSEFVSQYLRRNFSGLEKKIYTVYNGNSIDGVGLPPRSSHRVNAFLLTASKFVAYANQLNLLDGYATLVRTNKNVPPLWLAGGVLDKTYFRKVKALIAEKGLAEKVKLLGLVSYERMMQLYADASAFLFPSTLEACPQTLIEAMAFGLPIAASNVPPMPEICRDAAIYFNPSEPGDIAAKIGMLVTNQTLKENLSEKAMARCRFFSWDKVAFELVEVFQKVSDSR